MMGIACGACRILWTKMSKPNLCESSNSRHELQIVSDAPPFFEERSIVQADLGSLSQNNLCSFWYHLGTCRQYRSCANSIWLWIWFFSLNIISGLCGHVISRQSLHATWWCIQEKSRLITSHEVTPVISFSNIQEGQYDPSIFHSFLAQPDCQRMWYPMQTE
jgi:hypothetical protein